MVQITRTDQLPDSHHPGSRIRSTHQHPLHDNGLIFLRSTGAKNNYTAVTVTGQIAKGELRAKKTNKQTSQTAKA